jgi:hypothetical protein
MIGFGNLPLVEIAGVLVRLDHVARFIENANHSIMRPAEELGVVDCGLDATTSIAETT